MIKWIKNKIIFFLFGGVALASTIALLPQATVMEQLEGKTLIEKSIIKSNEIAKLDIGKYIEKGIEVEIIGEITVIEVKGQGGIEFLARAWKNGKQLGFGKDSSIEIERFRIYNPPILIDDANGDIIREWTDEFTGELKQRKLKYDPLEAIKQDLAHTVSLVAKDGKNIVKGKIGNTTSTFRPVAGANSPCDGYVRINKTETNGLDWNAGGSGIQDGSTGDETDVVAAGAQFNVFSDTTQDKWRRLRRIIFNFDTSVIDSDEISSAILTLFGINKNDGLSISPTFNIFSASPAGTNTIITADYDQFGTTRFSSDVAWADAPINTDPANFTLNASGISNINKSGVSSFGGRQANYDADNVEPTWSSGLSSTWQVSTSDETGTALDPKLVVVHEAGISRRIINIE